MEGNRGKCRTLNTKLGQYLVTAGMVKLRDVNRCLQKQRELRERGQHIPLGSLLVEENLLSTQELRRALAALGALTAFCQRCKWETKVTDLPGKESQRCARCGAELTFRDLTPLAVPSSGEGEDRASAGGTPAGPGSDALIDRIIGGCKILSRIARGGMGVVYRAKQLTLGRTVAIKILAEELASDEAFVRRFIREARAAAELNHPNIVHINDVGQQEGIFYFIMEYVEGSTLSSILKKRGCLDPPATATVGYQTSLALRHAHRKNIIHRDIKPENIMLTKEGTVKLADLGLAKRLSENDVELTAAGAVMGTPYYMAPEQAKDFSAVDQRSDIYSLGVTLYRTVTGAVPFEGKSPLEVIIKAISGAKKPVRERQPSVPAEFEAVIHRMMEPEPDNRYQDIEEVVAALAEILRSMRAAVQA